MRMFGRVPEGARIGHYARWNDVPGPVGGTYRQVFQHHDRPGAGAAEYTYSTFMFQPNNLYGAGQELTRGVPPACSPAADFSAQPAVILSQIAPAINGSFPQLPLLPDDLAKQFGGAVP